MATCLLLSRFKNVIYISCNPETLARDLQLLSKTHSVVRAAAFDQVTYTHHLEAGVMLVRVEQDVSVLINDCIHQDAAEGEGCQVDGTDVDGTVVQDTKRTKLN